ncbi:hypothetical protein Spiaf_2657 [Spirochaeta africana DSM 8902]|uniref:Uncharacterized protein n=2 Tax=Spirochaeta TaxID=146 RepID=H9UME0_SPIAZ|nr:hypothetical protein Spiaf_2657 [Spirochaeta africana DSM 8902]
MSAGLPSVLIPYPGPVDAGWQDIFVYLRPESNGVQIESAILKVFSQQPSYKTDLTLAYMANLPGEFMMANHVVENHYQVQLHFAVHGRNAFTPHMKYVFSRYFQVDFDQANIYGAFTALRVFRLSPEELFKLWVDPADLLEINGQIIKRVGGNYVVNYNIPALLHKHSRTTDIAVLMFRTRLSYPEFAATVEQVRDSLVEMGYLKPTEPLGRIFHYSKGPMDQLRDGLGYLYTANGSNIAFEDLSFARYLMEHGVSKSVILNLVKFPVVVMDDDREVDFFRLTDGCDYLHCIRIMRRIRSQYMYTLNQ